MSVQQPWPKPYVHTGSGVASSGYKLHTYESGTTTNKATYKDAQNVTEQTNPIILDSRGEPTNQIFYDMTAGLYKLVLKTDADVTVWTVDNFGEATSVIAQETNSLIPNGSFETDAGNSGVADNWVRATFTGGTMTLDTADQNHGGVSLKGVSIGTGGGTYTTKEFFPVSASRTYSITFDMKSTAAVRNIVDFDWYDSNKTLVSTTSVYDEDTANPTAWEQKNASATPPSTAKYAKIQLTLCSSADTTPGTCRIDNVVVNDLVISQLSPEGQIVRSGFEFASTTSIKIISGSWHHSGTNEQDLSLSASATFTFGSAGTNSDSTDLGNDEWHYVYLDDSAIVTNGTTALSNTDFVNSTTAPTYSPSENGLYNGLDRCIFAVLTDSSAQILEFFYMGGDSVHFADEIADQALVDIDTTWTDVGPLSIPAFAREAIVYIENNGAGVGHFSWRTKGQTGTVGHRLTNDTTTYSSGILTVVTDTAKTIQIKASVSDITKIGLWTQGWKLPHGL